MPAALSGARPDGWARFRRHRLAVVGLVIISAIVAVAVAAPLLSRLGLLADPGALDYQHVNDGASASHPLGTDRLGRDLLARTIYGARTSLSIAVLIQAVVLVIGATVGLVSGYAGGRTDNLLMRLTDVMFAFPDLLFVLVVAAVLGPGYWNILLAVGLIRWAFMARLVRGEVLSIMEQDYIAAARSTGTRPGRILSRHLLPNALGPIIVNLTFGIPAAIFLEAFLSFVGVGLPLSTPSWGVMINEGYQAIFGSPQQLLAPAVAISLTTLAFNFIGDGLRDSLDPRLRRLGP